MPAYFGLATSIYYCNLKGSTVSILLRISSELLRLTCEVELHGSHSSALPRNLRISEMIFEFKESSSMNILQLHAAHETENSDLTDILFIGNGN